MKRVVAFLLLVVGSVAALAVLVAWYLAGYQPHGGTLGGVMGQMMGRGPNGLTLAMPGWVWASLVALVALAVGGLAGLGYFLAYPEMRPGPAVPQQASPAASGGGEMSWAVLMRTSKPEEKRVLEVLAAHRGSYLQKFIVKESGLSRLKTHRILSRLAERGIVAAEKSGNTNEISLAPWLHPEPPVS